MSGAIRSADVLLHPVLISKLFGVAFFLRCLWAIVRHRPVTFLGMVWGWR